MNKDKIGVIILSIYKFFVNFARITIGTTIIIFGFSYTRFILFLADNNILPKDVILNNIARHIDFPSSHLAQFLAFSLIILSLIELVFLFALVFRKRWGAIGMFIMSIVWIPIEILFISRFLVASKIISLLINLIVIIFLYKLITKSSYFKRKKEKHKQAKSN